MLSIRLQLQSQPFTLYRPKYISSSPSPIATSELEYGSERDQCKNTQKQISDANMAVSLYYSDILSAGAIPKCFIRPKIIASDLNMLISDHLLAAPSLRSPGANILRGRWFSETTQDRIYLLSSNSSLQYSLQERSNFQAYESVLAAI